MRSFTPEWPLHFALRYSTCTYCTAMMCWHSAFFRFFSGVCSLLRFSPLSNPSELVSTVSILFFHMITNPFSTCVGWTVLRLQCYHDHIADINIWENYYHISGGFQGERAASDWTQAYLLRLDDTCKPAFISPLFWFSFNRTTFLSWSRKIITPYGMHTWETLECTRHRKKHLSQILRKFF